MSVFWIKEEVVKVTNLVSSYLGIREMEPGFTDEDEAWIFIIDNVAEIEFIPSKTFNIPA